MMASPSERQKHDAGFTLLEALAATVVMTVIERLAAIQVPRGESGKQSAR